MKISDYFLNKELLDNQIEFYKQKKQLRKIEKNNELVQAYLAKAKHNMEFFTLNEDKTKFNDWLIVTLYYALYHSALALVTKKSYTSKNHTATLLFLIKYYSIRQEEAELINELSISKEDAELYTDLKTDRHNASYETRILFTKEKIQEYRTAVINFIQKTEEIIIQD
ncbi:MAG: DNA-binding protein [Nanoarchaeota archaeon]|nr:DNA-binding protein [Nanoarchaeota archaeon]MBU1975295.1 DNA-binding protein [Nanoarchaeota archaeon]